MSPAQQPAVLVTGGAGYIGSHTAWALSDAGRRVVVLDDLSTGDRANAPPEAVFVQGSAADAPLVDRLLAEHRIGLVMHFAGSISVPESVADPLKYYANNTANSLTLARAAARHGAHMVFSSSAAVYAPTSGGVLPEDSPLEPLSPYGWSKLMTERMLQDAAAAGAPAYAILRYFNVAGADPAGRTGQSSPEAAHLLKMACNAALGLAPALSIYGRDYDTPDGTCVRDYIHVDDLAAAHLEAARHLEAGGASVTLNCGYGRGASVLEVVRAVERVTGRALPRQDAPRRPGDAPYVVADVRAIRRTLPQWTPRFAELDRIVEDALRWERRRLEPARAAG